MGRRALDPGERKVPVTVSLHPREHDEYCRRALREDTSVSEVIRRELQNRKTEKSQRER